MILNVIRWITVVENRLRVPELITSFETAKNKEHIT